MRRTRKAEGGFSLAVAPWLVAGAMIFIGDATATAQEGTPTAREVSSETTPEPAGLSSNTNAGAGGGTAPSTVPAAGVGAAFGGGGSGWLALGAGVGAAVAAAAALRERMTRR